LKKNIIFKKQNYFKMSDLESPDAYRVHSEREYKPDSSNCGACGTPWIWIILFIAALLAIVGLVIWLVYAYQHDKKDRVISLKSANINVASDTSITGTWAPTGKDSDVVTLWATLHPPKFNDDGTLANTNAIKSPPSTNGATTVTLSGLATNLKYYTTLIVTNKNVSNYQVYTQLVYMDSKTPVVVSTEGTAKSSTFAIQDILQVGKVQLTGTDSTQVQFNQNPSEGKTLWFVNGKGQIESNAENGKCLINSNGILAAGACDTTATDGLNNSKWSYNPSSYANRWCLTSTIANTAPTCMILNPISTGTATIKVADTSSVGDAWVNAFETA
jgi:hypothetical protein